MYFQCLGYDMIFHTIVNSDAPVCPYCQYEDSHWIENNGYERVNINPYKSHEFVCPECTASYLAEVEYEVTFYTQPMENPDDNV